MTGMAFSVELWPNDMYLSAVAEGSAQTLWPLLRVGFSGGRSTSITEAGWNSRPDVQALRFRRLAETVREECSHLSLIRDVVLHPAYQQIVGMGPDALPLILGELDRGPGHWFWALRAIAQEDPVSPDHRGVVAKMARDWMDWGRRKGLRW